MRAPSGGVITSWSFHAGATAPTLLKFKVARPAGVNIFMIVGESPPKTPTAGVLNTYTDVRIPVLARRRDRLLHGDRTIVHRVRQDRRRLRVPRPRTAMLAPGTTDSYGASSPSFQIDHLGPRSSPTPITTASATRPRTPARTIFPPV